MMYTGTTAEQDNRFSDKEKKLLKQMKFDNNLQKQVDMSKVKLDVIKPWIAQKITDVLGIEDDVVVHFVFNQLEAKFPDPKKMQINLTGFLNGKNARTFMGELWELLLSAQESVSGIPEQFMEKKKEEIKKRMDNQETVDTLSEDADDVEVDVDVEYSQDLRQGNSETEESSHSISFAWPCQNGQKKRRVSRKRFSAELDRALTKLQKISDECQQSPTTASCSKPLDQYDIFGKHVAAQMREMPERSFILLQGKMQTLITEERLNCLDAEPTISFSGVQIKPPPMEVEIKCEILEETHD